ncbi:UvrD-helicase domain-containing protein [Caldicellulosiruptor morganii]|uniref:DNA 3'-5' helicase n=1 Tax=Caldicellulosiruptor morganii TaxID=1387555 RepID=A0ABY7BQ62_9FIRM|nr:ATP-dependent DNA helicase [Caldicellulosiruptor morganii]WAM33549.1 ATP-dependent helicase [Caldicellulosiruptor morganii]
MPNITVYTASAGCGKTEKIADLYTELISEKKVLPQRIVAITYTEKAARELRSRIISKAKQNNIDIMTISKIQSSHIQTIHSFCIYLLRFYWMKAGVDANFKIVPELYSFYYKFLDDYFSLLPDVLDRIEAERFFIEEYFHLIEGLINEYSNYKKYTDRSEFVDKQIYEIFQHIEDMTQKEFLKEITYDLVLEKTYQLLNIPEVKKDVNSKFEYLIVDEFQDSNFLQKSIFENLCENIIYVGDKKQSIYRFQGAEPDVFDHALESCNSVVELNVNYRTNSELGRKIDAISQILFGDAYKPIDYYHRQDGFLKLIEIVSQAKDDRLLNEAYFVAKTIKDMVQSGYEISVAGKPKRKVRYSDFAILSRRINNIAGIYKKVFKEHQIPIEINFKRELLQESEILPLMGFLSVLESPDKKSGYIKLLANPVFKKDRFELLFSNVDEICSFMPKDLKNFIDRARNHLYIRKLSEIVKDFDDLFDYSSRIFNIFGKEAYENVMLFYDLLEESGSFSQDEFESFMISQNEKLQFGKSLSDACILMSIHSAKGLSFPVVFLAGLGESTQVFLERSPKLRGGYDNFSRAYVIAPRWDEQNYEKVKAYAKDQDKQELKRLFYVAITRAMAGLFVIKSSAETIKKRKGGGSRTFADEVAFSEMVKKAEEIGIEYEKVEFVRDENLKDVYGDIGNTVIKQNLSFPDVVLHDRFENRFRYLSPTHIMDFMNCKALFAFKYIMGLPVFDNENTEPGLSQNAKLLGTTVHRVLELTALDNLGSLNQNIALAMAENDFEDENLVKTLVYNFFEGSFIKSIKDRVIKEESEMPFYLKLSDQIIYGIIDKIYHLPDRVYLIDFKTNLHFDQNKFAMYIPQLFLYTKAMLEREPQKYVSSSICWLREGRMFEYKMEDRHLKDIMRTVEEIRSIRTKRDVLNLIECSTGKKECAGCDFEFYCKDEQNLTLVRKKLE